MKPWEREQLEYRPMLGYRSQILSVIPKTSATPVFKPSKAAIRSSEILGVDVIDNMITSLSKSSHILKSVDKCLSHDPVYKSYRDAVQAGDRNLAHQIYTDNMKNIDGKPQLDVIPLLEDLHEEMASFLDFVNAELFDGQADYNDTSLIRKEEERAIDSLLRRESEGKPVDYQRTNSRVKAIAAVTERATFYRISIERADSYLTAKAKDYVGDDIEGFLQYVTRIPESKLPVMREALSTGFRRHADGSLTQRENMIRVADRSFREMLDQNLSRVRQKSSDIHDVMLPELNDPTEDALGAEMFKIVISGDLKRIRDTYDYLVSEHISNTILNVQQTNAYYESLKEKKQSQSLYQLIGKIAEEFDRTYPEKEIPRFIKANRLNAPGTYCG